MSRADEMMQDYTRMDEDCRAALQIDNSHAGALYRSAQAKHALHDELNAVALLTQAIVQDEHLTEAYLLRAEILRDMGSLTEAEADIDTYSRTRRHNRHPKKRDVESRTAAATRGCPHGHYLL